MDRGDYSDAAFHDSSLGEKLSREDAKARRGSSSMRSLGGKLSCEDAKGRTRR
jgi:hypothetical protein